MSQSRGAGAGLTRRAFLGGAALALAGCAGIRGRRLEDLDSRVTGVLDRAISVDLHSHAAGAGFSRAPKFDLADRMRRGRMAAVCLCHSAEGPVIRRPPTGRIRQYRDPGPSELYEFTRQRLAFMDSMATAHGMTRVLTPADLDTAKAAGRPAFIGTIEGCHFMEGRLDRIEEVYRRGVRQLQIVHYMPSELGDQQTEDGRWRGLSALGADAVRECNRRGIVVDVAHGTFELVKQVARLSTAPFVLSHTSLAPGPLRPTRG
ncbi:MAG: membrane dipeptidase [Candidatus Rokuibacteriota bacterium]